MMVAVRIVPPTHEQRARADLLHAVDDDANRTLGLFAFLRDKLGCGGKAYPPASTQAPRPLVSLPPRGEISAASADRLCCSGVTRRRR
jgi:hypothetical protein